MDTDSVATAKPDVRTTEAFQKGYTAVQGGADSLYDELCAALTEKRGLLVGRTGTAELLVMLHVQKGEPVHPVFIEQLERNVGIFPREAMTSWIHAYTAAFLHADVLAVGWYAPTADQEVALADTGAANLHIPLRSLEPYYCGHHWTRALKGRRVCVVSSFAETAAAQLERKEGIWGAAAKTILPDAEWSFVRSKYSPLIAPKGPCAWGASIQSWEDAVLCLEQQVLATNPEVVLLGCGGLAMPLAHRLKEKGIVAIVLGGAIQNLFGIKGRRWATHPFISKLWTSAWVTSAPTERPGGAGLIEGGCYW